MSETKHTPGPWSVAKMGDDFNITFNEQGNWLATVFDDDDPVDGRTEADARLIAAAPELLEALKECLPLFDMVTALDDHGSNALGQAENLIRAAIARAEGRPS